MCGTLLQTYVTLPQVLFFLLIYLHASIGKHLFVFFSFIIYKENFSRLGILLLHRLSFVHRHMIPPLVNASPILWSVVPAGIMNLMIVCYITRFINQNYNKWHFPIKVQWHQIPVTNIQVHQAHFWGRVKNVVCHQGNFHMMLFKEEKISFPANAPLWSR
jgi:hypothetical protein